MLSQLPLTNYCLVMSGMNSIAITRLIELYDAELRRVMFRRCGCVEMAADIVQETYQKMMAHNLWQQVENPRAMLHRIAANLATDYERRNIVKAKFIELAEDLPAWVAEQDQRQPENLLANQQRLERLIEAVQNLPPKCREVFILRRYDDLSQVEIAEKLGISRNMVEKHLRKALQHLLTIDQEN